MEKRMSMNASRASNWNCRSLALVAVAFTLGACSMMKPKQAVEVSTADVNLNSSWHASIASPTDLAGAVQMSGSASMQPGTKRGTTQAALNVGNTSPGGLHPWAIHRGQCGKDAGVFGDPQNYPPLRVSSDGTGLSSATVAINTPLSGAYFVSVQASPANSELTVACGNLAAPTT
jgi:hypothetical protein